MSVPNDFAVVAAVYASGSYKLETDDGHAAFVDAVVSRLHITDANWGHVRKKPGQANIHDHGEDSALYKRADGTAWAVDFIGGANGPNPKPGWMPDPVAYYTHADWLSPENHRVAPVPPRIPILPKGQAFAALKALDAFYRAPEGLQRPEGIGGDMEAIAQWFYQMVIEGVSIEDVFTQIRASHEWRSKHP